MGRKGRKGNHIKRRKKTEKEKEIIKGRSKGIMKDEKTKYKINGELEEEQRKDETEN